MKLLTVLLEHPNIDTYKKTEDQLTALHVATKYHRWEAVTKLLSFDIRLAYACDGAGQTPLHYIFENYEETTIFDYDTWLLGALMTLRCYFSFDVTLINQRGDNNTYSLWNFGSMITWFITNQIRNQTLIHNHQSLSIIADLQKEMSIAEAKTRYIMFRFLVDHASDSF
jgi:hypothetical protein